jgi:hypothetical protein
MNLIRLAYYNLKSLNLVSTEKDKKIKIMILQKKKEKIHLKAKTNKIVTSNLKLTQIKIEISKNN